MKAVFKGLFLFLLLPIYNAYALDLAIEPSISVDFAKGANKNTTFSPSLELTVPIAGNFKGGLGLSYGKYKVDNSEKLIEQVNGNKLYTENSIRNKDVYVNSVPVYIFVKYKQFLTDNIALVLGAKAGLSSGNFLYNTYQLTNEQIATKNTGDVIYQDGIVANNYFYGAFLGVSYSNITLYINYDIKNYRNSITYDKKLDNEDNNVAYERFSNIKNKKLNYFGIKLSYTFNF